MSNCLACGHSVVAWCPEKSLNRRDLVCYNCGLHADSEATKRIRELEVALREMLEAEWMISAGWAGSSKREELIERMEKLLEPPRPVE